MRILTRTIYLADDTINNYAHVWYISDRLFGSGHIPIRFAELDGGRAFTFPYGLTPWLLNALAYPLLGDWSVTFFLVLGGVAAVAGVILVRPAMRDPWLMLLFIANPFFIDALAGGQYAFLWSVAGFFALVWCVEHRRWPLAAGCMWFTVSTHPIEGGLGVLAYVACCAVMRPRTRMPLLALSALVAPLLAPSIYFAVRTPAVAENSVGAIAASILQDLPRRGSVMAAPFALAWAAPLLRSHYRSLGVAFAAAAVPVVLVSGGALSRAPGLSNFTREGSYAGIVSAASNDYKGYLASPDFRGGMVYRVLSPNEREQGAYYLMRRHGVLANEFFGESQKRRSWDEQRYRCYLAAKHVDRVVVESGYRKQFPTNESVAARWPRGPRTGARHVRRGRRPHRRIRRDAVPRQRAGARVCEGVRAAMKLSAVRDAAFGSLDVVRRAAPLLAIGFLVDAAFLFVFLIALQSYLPESLHESDAIAGYALAAFGLAKLVTQLGSGFVADRLGTRRALILGTALLLIADASILPLAHVAPWLIIGAGAVEGLGSSVTWPALYSAGASRVASDQRGRFTALLTLATGGALVAGLGGGGFLNHVASFNAAMIAPIGAVGTAFVLALLTPLSANEAATRSEAEIPALGEVRSIISSPRRTAFALLVLSEAAALGALTAAFRSYGRDVLDVSLARQALMLAPAALLGGLLVVPGGAIADRLGPRRVMAAGFGVTGVCLLLLSRWSDPAFVVATAALAGAGFGLAVPTIASTMMSLAGPSNTRGGIIGWFMTMDGLGHAAGPAAAGILLGLFGAPAVMIAAGVLFLFVTYGALSSRLGEHMDVEVVAVPAGRPDSVAGG